MKGITTIGKGVSSTPLAQISIHKLLRNFIMRKQKETTCGIGKSTMHDIIVSEEYKDMIMEETLI